jgi:hypothetical protein
MSLRDEMEQELRDRRIARNEREFEKEKSDNWGALGCLTVLIAICAFCGPIGWAFGAVFLVIALGMCWRQLVMLLCGAIALACLVWIIGGGPLGWIFGGIGLVMSLTTLTALGSHK